MSRLLAAENVAGPAQLKIERGKTEPGTEVGKFADRAQAPPRDRRQFQLGRDQKIGIRAAVRTSDAAPKLVQLRQAVIVRTVDNNSVGTRDVDAILDDRCRNQDVIFVIDKIEHYLLHFLFIHLAVPDGDSSIGNDLLNVSRDGFDGFNTVVNEKYL